MTSAKKSVRTIRSRQDYELFKISYPLYDPQTVSSIELHLGPGQYLRPGQPLATLYVRKPKQENSQSMEQSLQTFPLTISLAGKIEKIGNNFTESQNGWKLVQGVKKGSLELLHIRQCEHIIKNQSTSESNITGQSNNSTPCDICPNCNKQIWIYYQNEEQIINVEYFLSVNPQIQPQNLKELEWSIIVNEQFTPNTVIAKVKDKEINLPILAKATYLLGEGEKPMNNVIMKIRKVICKHEKIIDNRCQFCLELIDFSQMQQFTRYLFQLGPNGIGKSFAKGAALLHQEQEYISSILNKKRLILILDLDNTILHSTEMNQIELKDLITMKEYFLLPKFQQTNEGSIKQDFIVIKMRPFLKQFLLVIGKLFEVYVYTKGTRIYADGICRWIRAQFAGQPSPYDIHTWSEPNLTFLKNTECFATHRVISRNQDTCLQTKSMQNILPTRTQYHLILDDRRDVWSNSPSWLFTREYIYFFRRKRNANELLEDIDHFLDNKNENLPHLSKLTECYNHMRHHYPQKSPYKADVCERPDYFLLFAANALKKIHNYFFEQFKKPKEQLTKSDLAKQDKKQVVSLSYLLQRTKQFLKGKNVRFFLAPGDQSISTARRTIKLGAAMIINKDTQKPDYVIRGNHYMKFIKKWRQSQKEKIKVIEEQYVNISVEQVNKGEEKVIQEVKVQKVIQQVIIKEKVDEINPAEKNNNDPSNRRKSKADEVIQRQINQPKTDYQIQLLQLEALHKQGIPVIAETWVLACYQYTYKFKLQDFKLQDPFKEDVQHVYFDQFIAKASEKLRIQINDHYGKQGSISSEYEKKKTKEKEKVINMPKTPQSEFK